MGIKPQNENRLKFKNLLFWMLQLFAIKGIFRCKEKLCALKWKFIKVRVNNLCLFFELIKNVFSSILLDFEWLLFSLKLLDFYCELNELSKEFFLKAFVRAIFREN
jgi:hypothetical protein